MGYTKHFQLIVAANWKSGFWKAKAVKFFTISKGPFWGNDPTRFNQILKLDRKRPFDGAVN